MADDRKRYRVDGRFTLLLNDRDRKRYGDRAVPAAEARRKGKAQPVKRDK